VRSQADSSRWAPSCPTPRRRRSGRNAGQRQHDLRPAPGSDCSPADLTREETGCGSCCAPTTGGQRPPGRRWCERPGSRRPHTALGATVGGRRNGTRLRDPGETSWAGEKVVAAMVEGPFLGEQGRPARRAAASLRLQGGRRMPAAISRAGSPARSWWCREEGRLQRLHRSSGWDIPGGNDPRPTRSPRDSREDCSGPSHW